MEYILQLENIVKTFPGVRALSGMRLSLKKGEIHAIVGENGAGKSTLIKIISGVNQPDSGRIIYDGKEICIHNPQHAKELGISVIYQETSLFPDLTVMENIFMNQFPRRGGCIDYSEMKRRASELFERLCTPIDVTVKVSALGIAMKQMVEIAKAMAYDTKILIMDEPTAALSEREVEALFRITRMLKKQGTSIIYISHRLEELFQIADTATVIRDGEFVFAAPVSELNKAKIIAGMVGRTIDALFPKIDVKPGKVVLSAKDLSQPGVIHNASLYVRQGEILGISGLAGAGRTELAMLICGLQKAKSGSIELEGKPVKIRSYREALQHGIVYVSEDRAKYGLELPMTVCENISFAMLRRISKWIFINRNKERELSTGFIQKLAIKAPSEEFVVGNLSGGNQQKVSVAKALACVPKLLILDEPTRGVDVGAKAEIHRIISQLANEGLSIILISSELPVIIGMSDRILVMRNGRIVGEFSREDATQENVMATALGAY